MPDDDLEAARERGWRDLSVIDAAYDRGELDREGWHAAMRSVIEPVYLAATTPQLGSGHHGTAEEWEQSRSIVMEAVDRDGSFLDVGCANGLLMESVARWGRERGLRVEPYGVDISAALADLARGRYPQWRDRIWAGAGRPADHRQDQRAARRRPARGPAGLVGVRRGRVGQPAARAPRCRRHAVLGRRLSRARSGGLRLDPWARPSRSTHRPDEPRPT